MGATISTAIENATSRVGRKRSASVSSGCGSYADDLFEKTMHTPKRRKLTSTSQYIYKALFKEGLNSNVTIVALGTEWKLHRVYLCQSPYFSSMFSGSWKEAEEGEINVGIEDPNITIDALCIVFGSLYKDDVSIEPAEIISVVAAATLFQLDNLIEQCSEIMIETTSIQTVIKYYEASEEYGLTKVNAGSLNWLLRNLMVIVQESLKYLRQISISMMKKLVSSSNLVVVQTEFSLYILLKTWLYLRENPLWDGDGKECVLEAHKYFQSRKGKDESYLETESGKQYITTFQALRLHHLVNHYLDIELLESDKIVPCRWFHPVFRNQWYCMLRVDQGVDRGPKLVSEEDFDNQCLRCGRMLASDGQHIWRWTGFNFGLDIIVTYSGRSLRFRRNRTADEEPSQNLRRHLMYRLTILSHDEQGQLLHSSSTQLKSITLAKNEELKVLTLEKEAKFPLLISANFLVTTPLHSSGELEVMG